MGDDEGGKSMNLAWQLTNLRTNAMVNPLGVETSAPLLSYIIEASARNQRQSCYQILVASTKAKLQNDIGDMWDSGKVAGGATSNILYSGTELASRQRVYWKVRAWNEAGEVSDWSEALQWEAGLLHETDWAGKWIGQGETWEGNRSMVPMFVKEFEAAEGKRIAEARLYISGLGLFEAHLNGTKVSNHFYEPGESDCRDTVLYVTYDVTGHLKSGNNAIGILLGNGMYGNYSEVSTQTGDRLRYTKSDGIELSTSWQGLYGRLKTIAQMEVKYEDGSVETTVTDESWVFTESPTTFSGWFGGEDYDATKEVTGWNCAGIARDNWQPAQIMEPPMGKLSARECPPITIAESFQAASVTKLTSGNYLVDMGRNGAGIPEIILTNTTPEMAGGKITLYPAEVLTSEGGADPHSGIQYIEWGIVYNSYVLSGKGKERWQPTFSYQGYRYLEVELSRELADWVPDVSHFMNHLLRTENEVVGTFRTSSEDINTIDTIITRAIESNMYSVLTDCPHMEKLGWAEVSQFMFNSISSTFDIQAWMKKFTKDMMDSQEDSGEAIAIAPEYQRITFLYKDPNWGGALILTPWQIYQVYGDWTILQQAYPNMKAYVAYLKSQTTDELLIGYAQIGEWGAYDTSTPTDFVATCAYFRIVHTVAQIAGILGQAEDAAYYLDLAADIQAAFNQAYYDVATGIYGSGSQASYACALFSELVEARYVRRSVDLLVQAIEATDFHLSTGEVALKQMLTVLADQGRNDIVYKMITNKTQPSYLYFVSQGATTLPEYWNMVRSQNHCMMGHAKEWLTRSLAGISPTSRGYDSFEIKPYLPADLAETEATLKCNYGMIAAHWINDTVNHHITLKVTIPVGPEATVYVPKCGDVLRMDGQEITAALDVSGSYYVVDQVGSGTYVFTTEKAI
jgi:alpha-L-rhamnosidase